MVDRFRMPVLAVYLLDSGYNSAVVALDRRTPSPEGSCSATQSVIKRDADRTVFCSIGLVLSRASIKSLRPRASDTGRTKVGVMKALSPEPRLWN